MILIFIYNSWFSSRWQWSVDLYQNKKQTAQNEKKYTTLYKNNIKTQSTQHIQQKYKAENKDGKNIRKYKSSCGCVPSN
jgi:hypothetical protein